MAAKYSTEQVDEILKRSGLQRIAPYIGCRAPLLCECLKCAYRFSPWLANVSKRGDGCPRCHRHVRPTDEQIDSVCKARNLKRVGLYKSAISSLHCVCLRCGYHCRSSYNSLQQQNAGCRRCSKKLRPDDEEIRSSCLGLDLEWFGTYLDVDAALGCTCLRCGNPSGASWTSVKNGWRRCKVCSHKSKPSSDIVRKACTDNCLDWDGVYKNYSTPLNCVCRTCHNECHPSYAGLQQGQGGCLTCSSFRSERKLRKLLEDETDLKWPSSRPKWLKATTCKGRCPRQIDCYNANYGIAFEFHGEQHYKEKSYYNQKVSHHSDRSIHQVFLRQQARDAYLRKMCAKQRVALYEVDCRWDWETIEWFVKRALAEHGLLINR
jgi:hypothetical protein